MNSQNLIWSVQNLTLKSATLSSELKCFEELFDLKEKRHEKYANMSSHKVEVPFKFELVRINAIAKFKRT